MIFILCTQSICIKLDVFVEIYKDDISVGMYKRGPEWLISSPFIKN